MVSVAPLGGHKGRPTMGIVVDRTCMGTPCRCPSLYPWPEPYLAGTIRLVM